MSQELNKILEMTASGKLKPEEAAGLIEALKTENQEAGDGNDDLGRESTEFSADNQSGSDDGQP